MRTLKIEVIGMKRLLDLIDNVVRGIPPQMVKAMWLACVEVSTQAKFNISMRSRSGKLMKSIVPDVKLTERDIIGKVGSNAPHARIQELGGVITPKRARALTIPMQAALTGRGVGRGRARDFMNTFIAKGMIFQRRGKDIVPLFKLRRRVQIRARPYLSPALELKARRVEQIFEYTVGAILARA